MSPDDPCVTRTRRRGRARHRRSKEITEDVLSRLSREGVKRVSHLPASVERGANVRFFLWVSCLLIRVQEDVFERRGGRFTMATALTSWTNMGTWFSSIFNVSPRQLHKLLELYSILYFRHEGNVNDKMQTKRKTSDKRTLLYAWVSWWNRICWTIQERNAAWL